jgi:hypothetical protein
MLRTVEPGIAMVPSRSKRQPPSPPGGCFPFCPSEATPVFVCHLSDASARAGSADSVRSKPARSASTASPHVHFHEGELEGKVGNLARRWARRFAGLSSCLTARIDMQ